MNRFFCTIIGVLVLLGLSGCGGGGGGGVQTTPVVVTTSQILSSATFDGDIRFDPPGTFTVTQGNVASVFAGIDPVTDSEFRAFLDFPLTGVVPGNAAIVSAVLEFFVTSITLDVGASTVPIRIELVSFQPPTLVATDFDRALLLPLAFTTIVPAISLADVGFFVSVDVTGLMVEAQRRGLADFQVRILEDLGPVIPGLIEISEANARAPLLEVSFF